MASRRYRPGPVAGGLREFGVVEEGAIRRQGDRHRVTIALAASDAFVELPGDGVGHDDFVSRHQVAVILQGLNGFVVVDKDLPGLGIEIFAAEAAQEWGKPTDDRGSLAPPDAKCVSLRWFVGGQTSGQEFVPVAWRACIPAASSSCFW